MSQAQEVFLFQPTSVSGCQLWLDAADVNGNGTSVANGATVSTWVDKSGNGRNATASVAASYSNGGVYFNNSYYTTNYTASPTFETSFIVFNKPSVADAITNTLIGSTTGGREIGIGTNPGSGLGQFTIMNAGTAFGGISGSGTVLANTRAFGVATVNSGSTAVALNGGNFSASVNLSFTADRVTQLGRENGTSFGYVGFAFEILFYNSVLSTAQRQQIEGYLAWKWGLQGSLPSNHPFKKYRPLAQIPIPPQVPNMPITTQNSNVFVPTQVSGCQLWLDAADSSVVQLVSGVVSQWTDKSSSGNNATQTTAANRPNYSTVNSRKAVVFTGTPTFMRLPNITSVPVSVFMIAASTENINNSFFVSLGGNPTAIFLREQFSPLVFGIDNGATQYLTSVRDLNTHIWSFTLPASANGTFAFDGTVVATSGFTLSSNSTFTTNSLGSWNQNSNNGNARGGISEIIMYTSALSTAQRQQVEGYLAWKWGLVANLPNGHPFKIQQIAPFPFRAVAFNGAVNQWQPTQISGCQLWLDAADSSTIIRSGTSVTGWRDKVNSILMTTQGTTSNATLINGINGRQSIYFNNSASESVYMSGTFSNLLTGNAFYVFQSFSQRAVDWRPFATWFTTGQYPAYGYLGGTTVNTVGPYTTFASPNGTPTQVLTAGSNYVISYGWGGTTTRVTTNGSPLQIGSQQPYSSSTSTFWIGADGPAAGSRITLYYGEMLFYNSVLSTFQRQQVEGYLAWKWGLQGLLPANHPFKRWPPPP
jgi:hypothetical protein